jgi:MFS family permease
VHLLVIDPFVWIAARTLTGFSFAGMFIVVESWLNAGASSENRGQNLSIYGLTGSLAGIGGQLLLPTTDPAGFRPFCIIASIISVALVPIALTEGAAPAPPGEGSHVSLSRLYRDSPLGVVAGFLGGVTTGAFFTLGPIFAERRGHATGLIAVFMACGTLGGFVAAWPLGLLSDRYDRRLVIVGAAAAAAGSLIAMLALVPGDAYPWLLYLCVALFGGMIHRDL